MYIWSLTVLVRWSYTCKEDDGEEEDYTVAARNYAGALTKVNSIALSKSRKFSEMGDDGLQKIHFPVSVVDIIKLERGEYIDG